MKLFAGILCLILFHPPGAKAQEPLPAGRSSVVHSDIGYSYANVSLPSLSRVNMSGLDFGVTVDLSRRFGLEVSGSYARGPNVLPVNQHTELLTYAGGVVLYPLETKSISVRVRALVGGAKQTGANVSSTGGYLIGFVNQPAWILGAAVDYKLDRTWSIRFSGDFLRSSFFDPAAHIVGQNNFKTGVGIVYTFGRSYTRSRK
jgi:hypothetical protein